MTQPPDVPGVAHLEPIASGVYRGRLTWHHTMVDHLVVVKVVPAGGSVERLDRDLRYWGGSVPRHPHIVRWYDAGRTADGQFYVVLPFLSRGSLADRLADRPFAWTEATSIGVRLAGALAWLHHQGGCVHGDVRPSKVLLTDQGEPQLGVARLGSDRDRTGWVVVGLERFLRGAPEVLGAGEVTPAADVFSLAATLYELIVGRAPFQADADEHAAMTIRRIVHEPPAPPPPDADLPAALWRVLERGLAKDPTTRPDAVAFARALQGVQEAEGQAVTELVVDPVA